MARDGSHHVRSKFCWHAATEHKWYGLTNSISEAHGWQRCPFVSRARRRVGSHWTMLHRQSCQPWSPLSQSSSSSSSSRSSPQSSSPHSSSPGARQLYCQESWPSALRPRNQLGYENDDRYKEFPLPQLESFILDLSSKCYAVVFIYFGEKERIEQASVLLLSTRPAAAIASSHFRRMSCLPN